MEEALAGLIILMFMGAAVVFLIKYRAELLNWLNKTPDKYPGDKAMRDFDTLIHLGIGEKDAIERIRYSKLHRKEIQAAIAGDEEDTAETGE